MLLRVVRLHARKAALESARPENCASAIVRDEFVYRGVSTDLIYAEPKAPVQDFRVDLVRQVQGPILTEEQTRSILSVVAGELNHGLDSLRETIVPHTHMTIKEQEAALTAEQVKKEVNGARDIGSLVKEVERLHIDLNKLKNERRYQVDKLVADQLLDLNLERGRVKEELRAQHAEHTALTAKMEMDLQRIRLMLEESKYDVVKYCIGSLLGASFVSMGLLYVLI